MLPRKVDLLQAVMSSLYPLPVVFNHHSSFFGRRPIKTRLSSIANDIRVINKSFFVVDDGEIVISTRRSVSCSAECVVSTTPARSTVSCPTFFYYTSHIYLCVSMRKKNTFAISQLKRININTYAHTSFSTTKHTIPYHILIANKRLPNTQLHLPQIDLSHAVDVYHDWIDACEAVNASAKAAKAASQDRDRGSSRLRGAGADRDREGSSSRRSKPYDRYEDDD